MGPGGHARHPTHSRPARHVCRWDVSGGKPVCEASFEGHTDWVNDIVLTGDLLASCSSDATVKLWRAHSSGSGGACAHTFMRHSDYVTRLAAPAQQGALVSAGLRGELFRYDTQTGQAQALQPLASDSSRGGGGDAASTAGGSAAAHASIYALAVNSEGSLVAAGASDAAVQLIDVRTGRKLAKLKVGGWVCSRGADGSWAAWLAARHGDSGRLDRQRRPNRLVHARLGRVSGCLFCGGGGGGGSDTRRGTCADAAMPDLLGHRP